MPNPDDNGDNWEPCFEGEAHARTEDPEESHISAMATRGKEAARLERIVLKALLDVYPKGLSNHGICNHTGLGWGSTSPRIKPLRNKGLVEGREDENGKPIRVYDSSQPSRVWFLTERGLMVAQEL